MNKWFIIGFMAFAVVVAQKKFLGNRQEQIDIALGETQDGKPPAFQKLFSETNPCGGKQNCVTVYLDSTNTRIQKLVPLLKRLDSAWNSPSGPNGLAIRFLVSGGPADSRISMAKSIGASAGVYDGSPIAWLPTKVDRYPVWILIDSAENILKTSQGFFPNEDDLEAAVKAELAIPQL